MDDISAENGKSLGREILEKSLLGYKLEGVFDGIGERTKKKAFLRKKSLFGLLEFNWQIKV